MHVEHTLPMPNQERLADVSFVSVENAIFRHRLKSYANGANSFCSFIKLGVEGIYIWNVFTMNISGSPGR